MRRLSPLLAAALLALTLAGCGGGAANNTGGSQATQTADPAESPSKTASPSPSASTEQGSESKVLEAAREVVDSLRDRDLERLASWIDPARGLRFSPYSRIDVDKDIIFQADDLPTFKDAAKRIWGTADGSGESIDLSFRDYFEQYVYDRDFAEAPNVNIGKLLGTGNTPSNIKEVYPKASFVEYHFPGTEQSDGMDWKSLVLVFQPDGGDYKLVSIVHGQWTI